MCMTCVYRCLQDQQCGFNVSGVAAECKGYKQIPVGDERALAVALFKAGPVSVGIDAGLGTFQFYQHGQSAVALCTNHRQWWGRMGGWMSSLVRVFHSPG